MKSVGGRGLRRGGFLGESSSDPPADFVSPLFDRCEVELLQIFVRAVNVSGDFVENLLETRFERFVSGGVVKHVGLP